MTVSSKQNEFAIVRLNGTVPRGEMGHAGGIYSAGHKLVTFASVEAALAYLPRYDAFIKSHYAHEKNWSRYNAHCASGVFLVVRASDVHPFGDFAPDEFYARVLHSDIG